MGEQQENLDRVLSRISGYILVFFKEHNGTFHSEDLRKYVRSMVGEIAPGSPDRAMRKLRQEGIIDYIVLSRREGVYKILREGIREMIQQEDIQKELESLYRDRMLYYHRTPTIFDISECITKFVNEQIEDSKEKILEFE